MAFSPETYAILKGKIKQLEEEIAALTGPTDWLGVTTTPITDGSTINPIVVNGATVTATDGSIASYNGIEFVFTGDIWQEFAVNEDAIHGLKLSITNGYLTLNEQIQFSMELTEDALSMMGSAEISGDAIIIDGPVSVMNNSMVYPA